MKPRTAAASSLRHLVWDDEILQWAIEFHLKDTHLGDGCRPRWFWACRLWSSSPALLTTARRGRSGPPPRSWGTLLFSGQRAPAAPETTRKGVRRGQKRSALDERKSIECGSVNQIREGGICVFTSWILARLHHTLTQEGPKLCWTIKKTLLAAAAQGDATVTRTCAAKWIH